MRWDVWRGGCCCREAAGGVCWGSRCCWAEHIVSPTPWEGSGIPPGWGAAGIGALAKRIVERPWRWYGSEVLGALQPEEHWCVVREGAGRAASRLSLSVWQQLRMEQAMGRPWGWVSCLGALQDAEPFAGGFSPAGREEARSLWEFRWHLWRSCRLRKGFICN